MSDRRDPRRGLPSVDALGRAEALADIAPAERVATIRQVLAEERAARAANMAPATTEMLLARVRALAERAREPVPRPVINATGVIINTNLGRAPLSEAAQVAMRAASGYAALEYDLVAGERGSRNALARDLLCQLTGAEDALVVNNGAAAVLLILAALLNGDRREVIVSRGQLVEIGGGFRIPDVLRQSGARLVEVGTTNRTRAEDYAAAITPATALLLLVHPSNFRVIGFTEAPTRSELAAVARDHVVPLIEDMGSGCFLDLTRFGLAPEPTPQAALAAGVELVSFSGDKLLGGPQAGIIVGATRTIQILARHPLMRALRVDKVTLAGLVATLGSYARNVALTEIPVWRMIALSLETLQQRAQALVADLLAAGIVAEARPGESTIGGGSLPGETLPTWHIALPARAVGDLDALGQRLRTSSPAVIPRIAHDYLLLDPRTVPPERDADVFEVLIRCMGDAGQAH